MGRRIALAIALAAGAALADGKFVSTQVPVVEIADQQALIVFKDGRERLVIDTAHSGDGDLLWIVPLPAPAKIEPVSPAVFRTLEVVTMPDVEDEPTDAWHYGLFLLVAVATMALIPSGWLAARIGAVVVLGIALALYLVLTMRSGDEGKVTVLGRGQAGSYETATLQSVDASLLLAWLQEHGFKVAPDVREGIEEYVREGWTFAVAKLRSGGPGGRAHPLSFEFETKEPVYPMRLTSTQDRALSVRLFVLSDRRARCDALGTESCYRIDPAHTRSAALKPRGKEREIGQPELLKLAGDAFVLTTLAGRTEPGQGDLRIGFRDYEPLAPVLRSRRDATAVALAYFVWVAFFLLLPSHIAVWAVRQRKAERPRQRVPIGRRGQLVAWCVALGAGLLVGAGHYLTRDIAPMRGGEGSVPDMREMRLLHHQVAVACEGAEGLEAARGIARRLWLGRVNPYTGLPVVEEPSPGNYELALRDGKVLYFHVDARGARIGGDRW